MHNIIIMCVVCTLASEHLSKRSDGFTCKSASQSDMYEQTWLLVILLIGRQSFAELYIQDERSQQWTHNSHSGEQC